MAQPPERQPSARLLLAAIDLYQASLSKAMPSMGVSCRFEPSCSRYAEGAIRAKGTAWGVAATARRLIRCGPWTPLGTVDPPPGWHEAGGEGGAEAEPNLRNESPGGGELKSGE